MSGVVLHPLRTASLYRMTAGEREVYITSRWKLVLKTDWYRNADPTQLHDTELSTVYVKDKREARKIAAEGGYIAWNF